MWALFLGLILAVVCAVGVYWIPGFRPTYISRGLINIRPALDPVLYETAFN